MPIDRVRFAPIADIRTPLVFISPRPRLGLQRNTALRAGHNLLQKPLAIPMLSLSELGTLAANVLARAICRAVYEAKTPSFPCDVPTWRDKFGK